MRLWFSHLPHLIFWLSPFVALAASEGFIGRDESETPGFSTAKASQQAGPSVDAPNILLIMTDDVGYAAASSFGGPIETPTFDQLANQGLRFNRFHTTAVCSPTRASLLTGRYPHNVNMGSNPNWPSPFQGYTGVIPDSAATIADLLASHGYATSMFGKGHLTPEWEMGVAGPFDRWPTGLGFQYFYGFLGADMDMFSPLVVENTRVFQPSIDNADYHLERDMTDQAIRWLRTQKATAPAQPFFLYFATGTAHAPNHAPRGYLDRYAGRFDEGWDRLRESIFRRQKALGVIPDDAKLSDRPESLPRWENLGSEQKALYAKYMEAYAASLTHADEQIGRILNELQQLGEHENTLVIYLQGDNGASQEGRLSGRLYEQSGINGFAESEPYAISMQAEIGGPETYPLIPAGWGWALNTPFPHAKRVASHLGGTRNALVMSWPGNMLDPEVVRSQFHHVSDIMPTILEVAGVKPPADFQGVPQQPLDGVSMAYTFSHSLAESPRKVQVFEMFQNMGLYLDGWLLSSSPVGSFFTEARGGGDSETDVDGRSWELYDLRQDFSQAENLVEDHPKRADQMRNLFWVEAARQNILPIHSTFKSKYREHVPSMARSRDHFEYIGKVGNIPEDAAPHTIGTSFTIRASVDVPEGGGRGVLVTHGGKFGGYGLFFLNGKLRFHYNALSDARYTIESSRPVPAGSQEIVATFTADKLIPGTGGTLALSAAKETIEGRIDRTLRTWISHTEGFDVGEDHGTPVENSYSIRDSEFNGNIRRVEIKIHD